MKEIQIALDGYWRLCEKEVLPDIPGIYCVYENRYNSKTKEIKINKLLYIGEAENVQEAIANHREFIDWLVHVSPNHELCFSVSQVIQEDRERGAAALIYKHNPILNEFYIFDFPFQDTIISLSGETALLQRQFTVYHTHIQEERLTF